MNKHFYNGPEIEIGKDFIRLKKKNLKLSYQDIKSIMIIKTRIDRAWLLYILAGIIAFAFILFLVFTVIQGLYSDSGFIARSGLFYRRRGMTILMFIFIGGPLFIIYKVKKYFQRPLMLVIKWDHHDFRIKISDMGIKVRDLELFLEGKIN